MKIGSLNIGTRLGIGFGLFTVMMLIINMRFAMEGGTNSRIIEKDWVDARRTMAPLIATDKSHVANANERIEAKQKTINEVLATLDKLLDLPEGVGTAAISNTGAS
ncbi:MAG: hypothetical protein WBJ19_01665 [Rhodoferax sp.]